MPLHQKGDHKMKTKESPEKNSPLRTWTETTEIHINIVTREKPETYLINVPPYEKAEIIILREKEVIKWEK